ncbi:MAG: GrpB family protein [Erysipelothrix sp.]
MNVIVEAYNEAWVQNYSNESRMIREIVGDNLVQIYHIGSTSVPGLDAKPVIDMLVVVNDLNALDMISNEFEELNYEVMGEFGMTGRRYYRKGGDYRTHQIHAFHVSNLYDIERHLIFRNYLRCHPNERDEYGALKQTLALQNPKDIDSYGDGKDSLVKRIERDALTWYYAEIRNK